MYLKDIRNDPDVKDTYFQRLVEREGTAGAPQEGRKERMNQAMRNWASIRRRCPEETTGLASRIRSGFA